jgi:predicted Zn-dependent protease
MRFGRIPSMMIVLLMAALAFLTCAVNPVTGKRELMLVSEEQEIAYGVEGDKEIVAEYGVVDNPAVADYVNTIGQNMCKLTHRPNLEYHFRVLDTSVINAFAVPGGYIYVTRGILAYLNDEAELAGVIGHELGHVAARHSMQQMSKLQLAQLGLGIGMALSEKLNKYSGLAEFGVNMLFLKFSRDDERQADDLGVEYGTKARYDTYRMASFFETLERLSPSDGTSLPEWFSTHPNPANRVEAVKGKTAEWQQKAALGQYVINRSQYLKTVNGIIYGDDPAQGYVDSGVFYHPTLKISFPVPSGWTVTNSPSQVQMAPEAQDASLLMSMSDTTSAGAAADGFISSTSAIVQSRQNVTVNGLSAQKLVSRVLSDSDTLQVMSYFITKGGNIFVLHGLSGPSKYSSYASTFTRTIGGFKQLNDASKINVKPEKLVVKTLPKSAVLRSVLKQNGVADDQLENMAILNGMQLNEVLNAGTMVKIPMK